MLDGETGDDDDRGADPECFGKLQAGQNGPVYGVRADQDIAHDPCRKEHEQRGEKQVHADGAGSRRRMEAGLEAGGGIAHWNRAAKSEYRDGA